MRRILFLTGLAFFSMVLPLLAQNEKISVQQRDNHYISVGLLNNNGEFNGGSIGYWYKLSDKNDLGLTVGINVDRSNHHENQSYSFSPSLKHYLITEKAYAPYIYADVFGSYTKNESDNDYYYFNNSESYSIGATGGIGVEWFAFQNISIGARVGLSGQYYITNNNNTYATSTTGFANTNSKEEGFSFNTFKSAVLVSFYF